MDGHGTTNQAAYPSLRPRMPDIEKVGPKLTPHTSAAAQTDSTDVEASVGPGPMRYIKSFERTLTRYNLEARGIERVMPEDRQSLKQLGFDQIGITYCGSASISLRTTSPYVCLVQQCSTSVSSRQAYAPYSACLSHHSRRIRRNVWTKVWQ